MPARWGPITPPRPQSPLEPSGAASGGGTGTRPVARIMLYILGQCDKRPVFSSSISSLLGTGTLVKYSKSELLPISVPPHGGTGSLSLQPHFEPHSGWQKQVSESLPFAGGNTEARQVFRPSWLGAGGGGAAHTSMSLGESPPVLSDRVVLIRPPFPSGLRQLSPASQPPPPRGFRAEVGTEINPGRHNLIVLLRKVISPGQAGDRPGTLPRPLLNLGAAGGLVWCPATPGSSRPPNPSALGQRHEIFCLPLIVAFSCRARLTLRFSFAFSEGWGLDVDSRACRAV